MGRGLRQFVMSAAMVVPKSYRSKGQPRSTRNEFLIRADFNLVPRVFSLSNMAAAGEKTLAHSELKRSLIGAFHGAFIRALSLVYSFQKQRWLTFEGFVEAEKCVLQCLRPKRWTEFRSDCSENCDCTVGRQRFEYSDIW